MNWFAIKHKKTGLFYNNLKWVELDKARIFKRKADLNNFLNYKCVMKYNKMDGVGKGLSYFENDRKIRVAKEKDFKIVNIKLEELE